MEFTDELQTALAMAKERAQRKVEKVAVYDRRVEATTDASALKRRRMNGEGGKGTSQLAELFRVLDSFGLTRSRTQKQLHLGMTGAVMQRIFDGSSDAEMRAGMRKHKITSCRQQFM